MSVERWLSHLAPRTQKVVGGNFRGFLLWLGENGGDFRGLGAEELVAYQRGHQGGYEMLDCVEDYIRVKLGTFNYKKRIYGSIRSFFAHNRCELPRDTMFRVNATRKSVVGRITVDEVRRVLAACNTLYRAVFLCMVMGGMGVGELLEFDATGLRSLLEQINRGTSPVRVDLPGRKRMKYVKPYYTYLGRDAVDALRVWLGERPAGAGEHVFCTQFNEPLSYNALQMYWTKKLSGLGLITLKRNGDPSNRYGKNLHELRDLFKTRWRISGVDIEVGDYFMGHDIDGLGYDKSPRDYPDFYREGYRQAEAWLNLMSEDPEKVPRAEAQRKLDERDRMMKALLEETNRRVEALERRKI